uniref:Uncharacterized protein n=1 Tax=Arundo donax TaxID=35708 RepID=A0A0A9G0Y7_ARUDO
MQLCSYALAAAAAAAASTRHHLHANRLPSATARRGEKSDVPHLDRTPAPSSPGLQDVAPPCRRLTSCRQPVARSPGSSVDLPTPPSRAGRKQTPKMETTPSGERIRRDESGEDARAVCLTINVRLSRALSPSSRACGFPRRAGGCGDEGRRGGWRGSRRRRACPDPCGERRQGGGG